MIDILNDISNNTMCGGAEFFLYGNTCTRLLTHRIGLDRLATVSILFRRITPRTLKKVLENYGEFSVASTRKHDIREDGTIYRFIPKGSSQEALLRMPRRNDGIPDRNNTIQQDARYQAVPVLMLYMPISTFGVIDVSDMGMDALASRIVGPIHGTKSRFKRSPIRIMQTISACATNGLHVSPELVDIMASNSRRLSRVKPSLIRAHLNDILTSATPSKWLLLMKDTGILKQILPELHNCFDVAQDPSHDKNDVGSHCLYTCDNITNMLHLRLAALFHDVGKPETAKSRDGRMTFYSHEVAGAVTTKAILKRFGYSKDIISKVSKLVGQHMFHYTSNWTDRAIVRFMKRVGIDKDTDLNDFDLFKIRKAERLSNTMKRSEPVTERQFDFEKRIKRIQQQL